MARNFVAASSQYLEAASATIQGSTALWGVSLWFRTASAPAAAQTLFGFWDHITSSWGYAIQVNGAVAGDPLRFGAKSASATYSFAQTLNGTTAGQWHHALAVKNGTNSRSIYLDGDEANDDTDTTSKDVTTALTRTAIGRESDATPSIYFNGDIAEVAVWDTNVHLTDVLVRAALAKGVSPLLIYPGRLVHYWPLMGRNSPEPDLIGRLDLTVTGAAQAAHCRVIQPTYITRFPPVPGGAAPTVYPLDISGSLSMTGVVKRQPTKIYASSMASAGTLRRQPSRAFASTLGSTGALKRQLDRSFASILNGSGAVVRAPIKPMAGVAAMTGALLSDYFLIRSYAGSLPSAGALARVPAKWVGQRVVSDDFLRPAPDYPPNPLIVTPIGAPWAPAGPNPMLLISNGLLAGYVTPHNPVTTPPEACAEYWAAAVFPADQFAECAVTDTGSVTGPVGGPCVRMTPTTAALSCYHAEALVGAEGSGIGTSTLRLVKYVNNVRTVLATYSSITIMIGAPIRLTVVGSTLRTYINGVEFGTGVTDTDLTSGAVGLSANDPVTHQQTPILDNWSGGEMPLTPTSTLVRTVSKWISPYPFSDDFNRAAEPVLGGNWDLLGPNSIGLVDNKLNPTGGSPVTPPGIAAARWIPGPIPNDHFSECIVPSSADISGVGGPAVRMGRFLAGFPTSGSNYVTCYAAIVHIMGIPADSTIEVKKWINNIEATLATIPAPGLTWSHMIRLTIQNNTLRVFHNGVPLGAAIVDADIPSGSPGLVGTNWHVYLDNWSGGALPKAVTLAGALARAPAKALAGVSFLSGILQLIGSQTVQMAGVLPLTGTLRRFPEKIAAGTIAVSGTVTRAMSRSFTGVLPLSSVLTHQLARVWTGIIVFAGSLQLIGSQTIEMAGTLPTSGVLARIPVKALAAAVATTGTVSAVASVFYSGIITAASELGAVVAKLFVRELTPTGELIQESGLMVEASGELTPMGVLANAPEKMLDAVLALVGQLIRVPEMISDDGVIPMSGELTQDKDLVFTGEITPVGEVSWSLTHACAGFLEATGELTKLVIKTPFEAALDLFGTLSAEGVKFVEAAGEIALSGVLLGHRVIKVLEGILELSGLLSFVPSIITRIGTIEWVRMFLREHGATRPTLTDESTFDDTELK